MSELLNTSSGTPYRTTDERLDQFEMSMLASEFPVVELPVAHQFTPGLYGRLIFMPAGTLLTSKIHNTEHQYVVLEGRVSVWIEGVGIQHIEAPFVGVTKPGTRRVLYIHEDCKWMTFHPLVEGEEGDVARIEERIIEKRALPDGTVPHEIYRALLDGEGGLLGGD